MQNVQPHGPIAVIDIETTGLFPWRHDRIIEIAAVVIGRNGTVEKEFATLVNPERDIGPTSIHGLSAADVVLAPSFAAVAAALVEQLQGVVAIAAHNVRFDADFLDHEFRRLGATLPGYSQVCTMQLAGGGKLGDCCRDFRVPAPGNAHSALEDARAAAALLVTLIADHPKLAQELGELSPIPWPQVPGARAHPVTREQARRRQEEPPSYLSRLLREVHSTGGVLDADGATIAYGALLDRVLEDRRVDDTEADALVQSASRWGMSPEQIGAAHRDYLQQLMLRAVSDGQITEGERREVQTVGRLLGVETPDLEALLTDAARKLREGTPRGATGQMPGQDLRGLRVCFTGELSGKLRGQHITRATAEQLAAQAGLMVVESVTKKLDILVVADPHTQSGKTERARRYGTRILQERVFWHAIGVEVA